MNQTEKSRPLVDQTREAAKERQSSGLDVSIAAVADMARYRRRRAVRRGCRAAYQHLAAHGLMSDLVSQVLDDIEREAAS